MKPECVMCDGASNENAFTQETTNHTKNSSPRHSTPVRQNDKKQRKNGFASSIAGFNLLPAHITPPSGLTKFIARNPFDADLTSRLHLSVISPTVFTKVCPTERHDSPTFSWSVDELALIHPAKIEEFPVQQTHSTDPDIEVVAQAAINKFFTENQIIPSPWANEEKKKKKKEKVEKVEKLDMSTPSRPLEDLNSTSRDIHRNKKDCWSQTVLSLPPILPKQVEEALRPYLTFNQDQNVDNEDANSSNSSLRRKLFFNHEDCTAEDEDEDESSFSISPSELHASMLQSSPPQSGMLIHGTPLGERSFVALQRTHGTPYAVNLSPPNMSPICRNDMSCASIRSRCQLASRLDFTTDMSIDQSIGGGGGDGGSGSGVGDDDNNELKRLEDVEFETNATSMIRSRIEAENLGDMGREMEAPNETTKSRDESRVESDYSSLGSCGRKKESFDLLTITSDWCKIHCNDGSQRNNTTILGNSCVGQASWNAYSSAQDTGYQTRSMNNITGNTDNFSISAALNTKSLQWNDKALCYGEDIKLSDWKDNMKNMFSSTPSKYSRRKDY